jgi:hypothetical protein
MDRKVENTQEVVCLVTEERTLENVLFVFIELEEDDHLEEDEDSHYLP